MIMKNWGAGQVNPHHYHQGVVSAWISSTLSLFYILFVENEMWNIHIYIIRNLQKQKMAAILSKFIVLCLSSCFFKKIELIFFIIESFIIILGYSSFYFRTLYQSTNWRCPWCNCYHRRKWTRRHEFKSWTRLIAFHIALIPLGKVWIQLFSLQLWVNSRTD